MKRSERLSRRYLRESGLATPIALYMGKLGILSQLRYTTYY
jgi:hypothetical protein